MFMANRWVACDVRGRVGGGASDFHEGTAPARLILSKETPAGAGTNGELERDLILSDP